MRETSVQIPALRFRASTRPSSYDESSHRFEVVWSTGERTLVNEFFDEPFLEELGMGPGEVDLARFQSGRAPVMDSHGKAGFVAGGSGLEDVLGVIRDAWLEDGVGVALVEFDQRSEIRNRGLEDSVAAGVLGNWSIGYHVRRYRDVTQPGDPMRVLRAIEWEPYEASLLPYPADAGTLVRAMSDEHPCVVELGDGSRPMTRKTRTKRSATRTRSAAAPSTPPVDETNVDDAGTDADDGADDATDPAAPAPRQRASSAAPEPDLEDDLEDDGADDPTPADGDRRRAPAAPAPAGTETVEEIVRRTQRQERQRVAGITLAFRAANLGTENDPDELIREHVDAGTPLARVRALALNMIANAQDEQPTRGNLRVGTDEGQKRFRGMAGALEHRTSVAAELSEDARAFAGMSLLRMAEESLEIRGERVRGMSPSALATRSMATGDFPDVLANVANKVLAQAYTGGDERTFSMWARRSEIPDFKPKRVVQIGSTALEELGSTGEIKIGSVGDKGESYVLATYAKRLVLTRQAIVNDDADAFDRFPRMFGQAAARLESDIVYTLLKGNPVLSEDGVALFDAAHGNTATDALAEAGLSAGRVAMRKQTDIDGGRINVIPRYLVVAPELETAAQKLTTTINPDSSGNVNVFQSAFRGVIVDPRLTSATEWYLMADSGAIDTIEFAYLRGESGPRIETQDGFATDGRSWRILHDFGAGALDFRGLYRGNV